MTSDHPLDRPVWTALTTRHAALSEGGDGARRFVGDVSPLAGLQDESEDSLAALAALTRPEEPLVVGQAHPIPCPRGLNETLRAVALQMEYRGAAAPAASPAVGWVKVEPLGLDDADAMVALANATQPGPYGRGSQRMGAFWGVKRDGRLVAMAGERMKQPGFSEVSGVCAAPEMRGQGLGRALSATVISAILARGETPYLHVFATNEAAIRLYESLGFVLRSELHVAAFERAEP